MEDIMSTQKPPDLMLAQPKGISRTYIIALIPSAVALNIVGAFISGILRLPIFLDLVGTMTVSLIVGPWWGVLSALLTSTVIALLQGPIFMIFGLVSAGVAIVLGYGVRLKMANSLPRYFVLSLLVAAVTALISTPIYIFIFGGATGHPTDVIIAAFTAMGQSLPLAVLYTKVLTAIADKPIQCFLALSILEALPPSIIGHLDFVKSFNIRNILWYIGAAVLLMLLLIVGLLLVN
jgi:energy-coupling factor transport system substrate-specific component